MMIYDYDNDEEDEQLKKMLPAAMDKAREEHTVTHDADQAIYSNLNTINDDNDQSKKVWPVQKTEGPCSSPSLVIGTPASFIKRKEKKRSFLKHTLKLVKERVLHWKRCGRWEV